MKLYNTLTRKKEEFVPLTEGKVLFYHCGPTVYWTQHIGNLRGMTMGDLVVRTLKYFGYEVSHVRNYTDVGHMSSDADTGEDKMEKGVKREGLSPNEIAEKYILQFEHDVTAINLLEPTHKPRATAFITEMIAMVKNILDKGYAYQTDIAVYFDTAKFPSYYALSRQKKEDQREGEGKGDVIDPGKKNPADFALWFFKVGVHKNALQTWASPFGSQLVKNGEGFPGWHIECSSMSKALLGPTLDIHMGGIEHIPVHHTNEIAQSEVANGVKFVNYWLHNGHLWVDGKKMAKSEGTGYALQEIVDKGFDPLALRYFFLGAQYRSMQNFTWEALHAAATAYETLQKNVSSWKKTGGKQKISEAGALFQTKFDETVADDFNVPGALGVVWEVVKSDLPDGEKYTLIMKFDEILGLRLKEVSIQKVENIPSNILELVEKRKRLRSEKLFAESDEVRKQIEDLGYVLEDSSEGTTVSKKK